MRIARFFRWFRDTLGIKHPGTRSR